MAGHIPLEDGIGVRVPDPQLIEFVRAKRDNKFIIPSIAMRGASSVMKYHVYILKCTDGTLYVGCTNDLTKRLKQHNESRWGVHYTKLRRPVALKYFEMFDNSKDARCREREIKSWRREKKLNLIQSSPSSAKIKMNDLYNAIVRDLEKHIDKKGRFGSKSSRMGAERHDARR